MKSGITVTILVILLFLVCAGGYISNAYKLAVDCDFAPTTSYKCEIVRTIGLFVPPVGIIAGYLTIEDGVQP